jgi:hypothetical protein
MNDTTNQTLINLTNPEFSIAFKDNTYTIRKATLDKAVAWQQKVKELANDPAGQQKIVAFCLYIMLKDKIPDLTEDDVLSNTPADIDSMEIMVHLGFLNSTNLELAKAAKAKVLSRLTIDNSSLKSPTEQVGLPIK